GVTVYRVWKICSKIQVDSLSNTVVAFIDCESAVRAMTRSPPRTGVPAAADVPEPEPEPDPDDPPHPARAASALTAIRVIAVVVRCFTVTPCSVWAAWELALAYPAGGSRRQGRTNLCLSQDDRKTPRWQYRNWYRS